MPVPTIDTGLCPGDHLCAGAGTLGLPSREAPASMPEIDKTPTEQRFRFGHSMAICPKEEISQSHIPEGAVTSVSFDVLPDHDQVIDLVRSRHPSEVRDG